MSVQNPSLAAETTPEVVRPQKRASTFNRLAKYTLFKLVMLFITVVIAVYLTIIIANMGGYVDEIVRGTVREFVGNALRGNRQYQQMAPDQKNAYFASQIARVEKRYGLDKPFYPITMNGGVAWFLLGGLIVSIVAGVLVARWARGRDGFLVKYWGLGAGLLIFMGLLLFFAADNQIAFSTEPRSVKYLVNALTLDFGNANLMASDTGSRTVSLIILDRLAPTLLLVGTSNLILFFVSIFLALALSRSYGTLWDKIVIGLSPTSSAPAWFYGLFFILFFAAIIRILPFGGMIDSPPPRDQLGYILNVGKHLILPVMAIIASSIFVSIYNWRTFFLIYSSEDYVEMARAKGLSDRDVQSRYILRPTLPTIITSFALLVITLWQGLILTEGVFQWPGLGRTYITAIGLYDTPVIVALTIIYAYLLAMTVFILDFVYALVDPRVKVGS